MIKTISYIAIFMMLSSCSVLWEQQQAKVDSWFGKSTGELYSYWGAPNRTATLENGDVVSTYDFTKPTGYQGVVNTCQFNFTSQNGDIFANSFGGAFSCVELHNKSAP